MSFLRQLFRITTRRDPTVQKLARPNHKALVTAMDYEKEGEEVHTDNFFDYIIGYMTGKKIPLVSFLPRYRNVFYKKLFWSLA